MNDDRFIWGQLYALDCPEAIELANFYARLLRGEVEPLGDFPRDQVTWIEVLVNGQPRLGFQKIEDYRAPTWPEGPRPQQAHLDFFVDDLEGAAEYALSCGAVLSDIQPGLAENGNFLVFFDPVGHPFCLVRRAPPL